MQSLSIAATGMMAQQLNVEVISNNIANMSTSGFKRQRAEFRTCSTRTSVASAPTPRTREPSFPQACRLAWV